MNAAGRAPPVRISVITVCRDRADTIADTCRSLRAQGYARREHIIVDGASRDRTVDIARQEAEPGALIVSAPDRGIYDAMNKGLALARGDVIGFLNADDVYHDARSLGRIAAAFADPAVQACYGDLVYVERGDLGRVVRYWNAAGFTRARFAVGAMPPHPTFYARREVFARHGGFDLALSSANDVELLARFIGRHRLRCVHIPAILVRMRLGGVSNRRLRDLLRQNLAILRVLRRHRLPVSFLFPVNKLLDKLRQFIARPGRV